MRALQRFVATNDDGSETRWFTRGEKVPPEFRSNIRKPGLVDQPLEVETSDGDVVEIPVPEFPSFPVRGNIEEILGWVSEADDYDERVARADHALAREEAGQQRKGLLEALPQFRVED